MWGVYLLDKYYYSSVIARSTRAIYVLLWIAYEYGFNSLSYTNIDDLHEVASDKLLHLLVTNKGIFIKLGQAIANQGKLFPDAYQRKFPMLYDQAPVQPWSSVDGMLKRSLGDDYEMRVFETINHEPIASASVAQVHYARLKSGEEVAVKVQHEYISRQLPVDLWVYRFISRVYERVFDIPLGMFTKYISEKITEETNFRHEMQNSDRLQALIGADATINDSIYIPKNFAEFTTLQVLTAEWIDGVPLTHKDVLLDKGFDLAEIMRKYIKLFGAQIFKYGFIHSDPHPGNLLVRLDSRGRQQLVLLDHGLYIELPELFRIEYCNLWRYLFLLDTPGIEEIGKKWGISSLDLFATVVQLRPVLLSPEQSDQPDSRNVSDLFRDFIGDKKKFPADLPFLARTMRMIQNLNQSFGSPVNRINLLTKELVNALLQERHISFGDYWSLLKIKVVLVFSDLMFYFVRIRQYFIGDRYGGKGKGLEDYIEMYMQNTAKSLGMEWI
ncbi:ABC1 family protein C10F6.14c [Candida viswanathii]|uniref:ABC1 family protein C10F6.14c n=1 Tax=Candida viswanathii TaxID=5486 RepID=A0A367YGN2_9ASCO|nr:ABC1 family protein C10F6.14c [Candida viswanathii]